MIKYSYGGPMKKILLILTICLLFTGCSLVPRRTNSNVIRTDYGSFSIPNTWTKREDHSTTSKYFFANKRDKNSIPNNISVEVGKNRYSAKEHMQFKDAITRQLAMQASAYKMTLNGTGSTTKNGYAVYTFELKGSRETTIQHYIVGEYKYVLVHETIFRDDNNDTNNAAKTIVNSFEWK